MINTLSETFGSKTKAQEILFLMNDLKKVVRQGFYDEEIGKVKNFCFENRVFCIPSKFRVVLEGDGFTNKGLRNFETNEGLRFYYISKDEKDAYLAAYHELMNDHRKLGELLGYPRCCIEFFIKNFSEHHTNPEIKSKNMYTNISQRKEDCVLISHFPCSENCKESLDMGKRFFEEILVHDKKRAKELKMKLSDI